jgi:hypothetical protein
VKLHPDVEASVTVRVKAPESEGSSEEATD